MKQITNSLLSKCLLLTAASFCFLQVVRADKIKTEKKESSSSFIQKAHSLLIDSVKMKSTAFFGDFNAGYSSFGAIGRADLYYRKSNWFLSTGYSKSHICYLDIPKGEFSQTQKASDSHVTIQSFCVKTGIISHGILYLSGGLSYSRFEYEKALPMCDILSVQSVWNTALGKNFGETVLKTTYANAFGIPLEARLNFSPKRFVGFTTAVMAHINSEKSIFSVEIGIRLGRITKQ